MDWRLILDPAGDPPRNMAIDEAMLTAFCRGLIPPTIRLYTWSRPAVSIGYFQSYERSICRDAGAPAVRRPTGGRAVAHGTDITFTLVAPADVLGARVADSYRRVGAAVRRALLTVGMPAELCGERGKSGVADTVNCFEVGLKHEVSVGGRKVLGSAQARRGNAVLQQNSLMLRPAPEVALAAMKGWLDEPRPHSSTDVGSLRQAQDAAVEEALITQLAREFGVVLNQGELTPVEEELASHLEPKYVSAEWTERRVCHLSSTLTA